MKRRTFLLTRYWPACRLYLCFFHCRFGKLLALDIFSGFLLQCCVEELSSVLYSVMLRCKLTEMTVLWILFIHKLSFCVSSCLIASSVICLKYLSRGTGAREPRARIKGAASLSVGSRLIN